MEHQRETEACSFFLLERGFTSPLNVLASLVSLSVNSKLTYRVDPWTTRIWTAQVQLWGLKKNTVSPSYWQVCICGFNELQVENSIFTLPVVDWKYSPFKKDAIYLFLERGRESEREGEKHHCVVASHMPPTGDLALSPGMGIELVTLWFAVWCSIHWATPARAKNTVFDPRLDEPANAKGWL